MERLTQIENGMAYFPECFKEPCCGVGCAKENCDFINKKVCEALDAYEKLGLTPAQIAGVDNLYAAKCKEVAILQKELENSVKLPCKVGDTIYYLHYTHKCDRCKNNGLGKCKYDGNDVACEKDVWKITEKPFSFDVWSIYTNKFYPRYYLTREEAEKALSEVKA